METTYNYKTYFGTAPNPTGGSYPGANVWDGVTAYTFGVGIATKIIMVWAHDQRLVIRFSYDGITYGDDIVLYPADQAEPFYYAAKSFQVINYLNGANCVYQVMGQW